MTEAIAERSAKSERLAGVIRTLEAQDEPVAEFDERLWGAMVDYVTVGVLDGSVPGWDGDGGMMGVTAQSFGSAYFFTRFAGGAIFIVEKS